MSSERNLVFFIVFVVMDDNNQLQLAAGDVEGTSVLTM